MWHLYLPFAGDDAQLTIAPKHTLISIISESVEQRHDRPCLTDSPDRALKAALPFDVFQNLVACLDRPFQAGVKGDRTSLQ